MLSRVFIIISIVVAIDFTVLAQRTVKVVATYTYITPDNVSLDIARETALERAKIQAIADEFGTTVSQMSSALVSNVDGKSKIDFTLIGNSEIKGEWIETIDDPKYDISYEQNVLVVKVEVKGRIREINSSPIDFKAKILCNGTDYRFERTDFSDGDDLYLAFQSPISGYLAVYLADNDKVFCLLPYRRQSNGIYNIEANREYILFSEQCAQSVEDKSLVDEYTITASKSQEKNLIYIIFSPNNFVKAADFTEDFGQLPRQLEYKQFQRWLSNCRIRDKSMRVEKILLTIQKK